MTNIGNIGMPEEYRAFEQCKQHIYIVHVIDETYWDNPVGMWQVQAIILNKCRPFLRNNKHHFYLVYSGYKIILWERISRNLI